MDLTEKYKNKSFDGLLSDTRSYALAVLGEGNDILSVLLHELANRLDAVDDLGREMQLAGGPDARAAGLIFEALGGN